MKEIFEIKASERSKLLEVFFLFHSQTEKYAEMISTSHGGKMKPAVAYCLMRWIPNPEVLGSKPLGGSKVNSAFHPFKGNQLSTRNS